MQCKILLHATLRRKTTVNMMIYLLKYRLLIKSIDLNNLPASLVLSRRAIKDDTSNNKQQLNTAQKMPCHKPTNGPGVPKGPKLMNKVAGCKVN